MMLELSVKSPLGPDSHMPTNLSDHFTLEEAVISQTASRQNIPNVPTVDIQIVMMKTARCLERIRALLQEPIIISSWYRSPALNHAVGGVPNSQHQTGEAVDFICPSFGTPADICKKIILYPELVSFDQLILEHTWIHISFSAVPTSPNRKQVLSLLQSGHYASGLTDNQGVPI